MHSLKMIVRAVCALTLVCLLSVPTPKRPYGRRTGQAINLETAKKARRRVGWPRRRRTTGTSPSPSSTITAC